MGEVSKRRAELVKQVAALEIRYELHDDIVERARGRCAHCEWVDSQIADKLAEKRAALAAMEEAE